MIELPERFRNRLQDILKQEYAEFVSSYNRKPYKAIRINTLKIPVEKFKNIAPFKLCEAVPWEDCGFYVEEEKAGKSVLHAAGLYYVQEPSAMSAAQMLNVMPGERVLDMCSAPGGKGTQLAQKMLGKGIIILNEINFSRAKILSQNVERLGICNAMVTCCSPEQIAQTYPSYFDKVLVDAPCSGEGMFLKEPEALSEWSEKNVMSCAVRQAEILECAQRAVKPGGLLLYSTCTFAPEEDELQIERFLSKHSNFSLVSTTKLWPHKVKGEGHFVALMKKDEGGQVEVDRFKLCPPVANRLKEFKKFEEEYLNTQFKNLHLVGDTLYSIMENCPRIPAKGSVLRAGIRLGEFINDRFEPSHTLAMSSCLCTDRRIEVSEQVAKKYLKGETFDCPEEIKGWAIVTHCGYAIGWCKCVGGIAKNHLPKGLRI